MRLQDRWNRLWSAVGGNESTHGVRDEAFRDLVTRYGEPHRAYHTLAHVESCLRQFDRLEAATQQPLAVEWAIWFHDARYDPHVSDNEEQSAAASSRLLRTLHSGRQFSAYTSRLILATKFGHVPTWGDERILVDIDHSILCEPADVFDAYDRAVRHEYAFVPWADYVTHRTAVLRAFLARQPFFSTQHFWTPVHEEALRLNLLRALDRLGTQPDPLLAS